MISCTVHQNKILGLHTWLLLSIAHVLDISLVFLNMVAQLVMVFLNMVVLLVMVFLDILDFDMVVQLVIDFLNIYYIQFVVGLMGSKYIIVIFF